MTIHMHKQLLFKNAVIVTGMNTLNIIHAV